MSPLYAQKIDTFYGPIQVEEPILLELIDHPVFQRLKFIHQYGVAYYTTFREEFTRYDHSLGVLAILRTKGSSLQEQIAGLLHDVSHTAFSHVGDWIFGKQNQEKDYQSSIHSEFLKQSGLEEILKKYDLTADEILPEGDFFPALKCPLPNLCADRIDYNIQGAFHQGFITYEEAQTIFQDLEFTNNIWTATCKEPLKKLTLFSLFMTARCWGDPTNYLSSLWLAEAILRGVELGDISYQEIHFGTDQAIWDKLIHHQDPFIQKKMSRLSQTDAHYSIVLPSEADFTVKCKFRGVDPWILQDGKLARITSLDPDLFEEYEKVKSLVERGWPIKVRL